MRKKMTAVILVGTLMSSLLTGCGAGVKATNQAPESSEVVEADGSDETENVNEETEKNTAATDAPAGAEDENIVLYAEKGSQDYCPLNEVEYELHEGEVTATEDILLYNEKGYCVGYIKNGATVSITEYGSGWTRFKNPIDGTDYDYLYVLRDYVTDLELFRVTASDVRQTIIDEINNGLDYLDQTILDTPTDDMEVYEYRMDSVHISEISYRHTCSKFFYSNDFSLSGYQTYYIECEEDTDGWIICRIYFKDPFED